MQLGASNTSDDRETGDTYLAMDGHTFFTFDKPFIFNIGIGIKRARSGQALGHSALFRRGRAG